MLTVGQPLAGAVDSTGVYDGSPLFIEAQGDNDTVLTNGNLAAITLHAGSGDDQVETSQVNVDILTLRTAILPMSSGSEPSQYTNSQIFLDDGDDTFVFSNLVGTGVSGGNGNDSITATNGTVIFALGQSGSATSTASSINGNADDAVISIEANAGDTGIYGGRDNDIISIHGSGIGPRLEIGNRPGSYFTNSVVNGNKGNDQIEIFTPSASSSAWSGTAIHGGADHDTISLISGTADLSGVYGDLGQDKILATFYSGAITAFGGDGNDSILGGNGDDQLHDGLNADVINGSGGNDVLQGGDGSYSDTFVFGNRNNAITFGDPGVVAASATYAGLSSTVVSTQMTSIDTLIGTDLVTDYDLADDNIHVIQGTFGGTVGTLNASYTGNFGTTTNGTTISWVSGINGATAVSNASSQAFYYDQTDGSLWFVFNTTGSWGGTATSTNTFVEGVNAYQVAIFDTTPSINNGNYSDEIFVSAQVSDIQGSCPLLRDTHYCKIT